MNPNTFVHIVRSLKSNFFPYFLCHLNYKKINMLFNEWLGAISRIGKYIRPDLIDNGLVSVLKISFTRKNHNSMQLEFVYFLVWFIVYMVSQELTLLSYIPSWTFFMKVMKNLLIFLNEWIIHPYIPPSTFNWDVFIDDMKLFNQKH